MGAWERKLFQIIHPPWKVQKWFISGKMAFKLLLYVFSSFIFYTYFFWSMQTSLPKRKFSSSLYIPIFQGGSVRGYDLTLRAVKFPHYHASWSLEAGGLAVCLDSRDSSQEPFWREGWPHGLLLTSPILPPPQPEPSREEQKQTSSKWNK